MFEHWRHKAAISDTHTVNIASTGPDSRACVRVELSHLPGTWPTSR